MKLIKPITLEIDSELWRKFKEQIPRTIKLNDAIVTLISEEVEDLSGKPIKFNKKEVVKPQW